MRTTLALVLAVILGVAAGVGAAALRIALSPWDGNPGGATWDAETPGGLPDDSIPRLEVDQPRFDFGTMDIDAKGSHDFLFTNTGAGTLKLTAGETSCKCTGLKIEQEELAPGQSSRVTVSWSASEVVGPFRVSATVLANDPEHHRVELSVTGEITVVLRPLPDELVFTRISAGEPASSEVRLLCYLDEPLEVLGYELLAAETAAHFQVTFEPLPSDQLEGPRVKEPSEAPGERARAKSGYLMRLGVKPGLPLGRFQQKIRVSTNLQAAPQLVIPVQGTVASDIWVAGPGWNRDTGVLELGNVDGRQGAQRQLRLLAGGPHRREVRFTRQHSHPPLLDVELGEPRPIGKGAVLQTPLIIRIPKDSPPMNCRGVGRGKLGEILLQTNHPKVPVLRILVSFVVEG